MKDKSKIIGIEKHVRITDTGISDQIDRLMELPEYKSFNKVINNALFYGLPKLTESIFGEVKLDEQPPRKEPLHFLYFDEKQFAIIVRLLKETILNVTINKSILSSLFHAKDFENNGLKVDPHKFEDGLLSDTPDYLNDYEIRGLKSLRQ